MSLRRDIFQQFLPLKVLESLMNLRHSYRLLASIFPLCLSLFSTAALAAITDAQLFAFAEGNYPSIFAGTPVSGALQPYNYRYYPASQNYLATDTSGAVFILGPYTAGQLLQVAGPGILDPLVISWETKKTGICTSYIPDPTFPLPSFTVQEAWTGTTSNPMATRSSAAISNPLDLVQQITGLAVPNLFQECNGVFSTLPAAGTPASAIPSPWIMQIANGVITFDRILSSSIKPDPAFLTYSSAYTYRIVYAIKTGAITVTEGGGQDFTTWIGMPQTLQHGISTVTGSYSGNWPLVVSTRPSAPIIGTAIAGDGLATVSFLRQLARVVAP